MVKRSLLAAGTTLVLAGSALLVSLPAHAASGVTVAGHCTGSSTYSLQVQKEDTGQISVDWGVDMSRHVKGVAWNVNEWRNGVLFVHQTAYTISDGSFSITRLLSPQASNHISAVATNPRSGETCSASASI